MNVRVGPTRRRKSYMCDGLCSISNNVEMEHGSKGGTSSIGKEDVNQPPEVSSTAKPEILLQKAQNYKNTGNVYFKTGKYDEAIAQYNKAIDICPKENVDAIAIFYQNRAAAYEQLKKYKVVMADCTKALELNPRYMKALLRRVRALDQIGNFEAALKDLTTICIHEDFCNRPSLIMADKILIKLVEQRARENLTNKKFIMTSKNIIKVYLRSFSKDPVFSKLKYPENIPKFFKKPLQALKDEEYDDVIPLCTEVIKKSEFDTLPSSRLELLLLRATFYLLSGDYDAAVHDFESILTNQDASDDMKINVLIKRANIHIYFWSLEMAFKDFELAININPNHSDIYYHRGWMFFLMDKIIDAKNDFEKAIEYNRNFGMAYVQKYYMDYNLALFCTDMRLVQSVARDFQKVFEKRGPENLDLNLTECTCCYVYFAEMMATTQQYRKADTYFAKAMRENPEDGTILVKRSLFYLKWKGDVDKTVKYIEKAIELDEKCTLAYKVLGNIEVKRGNIEEAIRWIDKAIVFCNTFTALMYMYNFREIAKIQLHIKNQLGSIPQSLRSFFRFNDIRDAEESDEQIFIDGVWTPLRLSSKHFSNAKTLHMAQKYKNEGNVYFVNGKYDEAIAQYNKAIDICPKENVDNLAIFYQHRAAAYEQLKKYNAVRADCTKALELNPRYPKALLRRARALQQIGDLKAALEDMFTTFIYEGLPNPTCRLFFDYIMEKLGQQHINENLEHKKLLPSKHVIEMYIMSFSKDPVFSRLQHPENNPKFFKKPLQALKDKKYDDVIPLCTEVIKRPEFGLLPSSKLEVILLRATFYSLLGDYNAAIDDFERILTNKDASNDVRINALIKIATIYMQIGKSELSLVNFQLAVILNPGCSDIYYHRGQMQLLLRNIDEAKYDFEKAFEYNPNFSAANIQKCYFDYCSASSNRDGKSVKAAVRNFERAFKIYPNPPEYICCCILYAEMMSGTQQYQRADTYFARAIEKDPKNAPVYVQRGLLQLKWNGNVNLTVEYVNKALELDENCRLAYAALGTIEIERGNLEEAMRLFDKTLSCCRTTLQVLNIYSLKYIARMKLDINYPLEFRVVSDGRSLALSLIKLNYSIHNCCTVDL